MLSFNNYIKCTALLLVYGVLSLWQPAFAAITVTAGGEQQVFAGADSAAIVFSVVDEHGNPNTTGVPVNFNLLNPTGNAVTVGLLNFSDKTDENGQVSTRLKSTDTLGKYTLIATLTTDATQSVSTHISVLKDSTAFTVISGGNQEVFAGLDSADIVITLVDKYGKPNVGVQVNFSLVEPTGNAVIVGLSKFTDKTDDKGQVSTRLKSTEVLGKYTISATLATDSVQSVSTTVTVMVDASAIVVNSGGNQEVPAGSDSAEIVFTLLDKYGKPNVGALVNFSLVDPTGSAVIVGLSAFSDETDDTGQVSTRLKGMETLGNYTITATLATDNSLSGSTDVVVVLDVLTNVAITLISGSSQQVPTGSDSADIVFKVINKGGNPSKGVQVNFSLVDPMGNSIVQEGLTAYAAETHENGQVSTRFKGTDIIGSYTITATVATNTKLFTGTNVVVVAGTAAKLAVIEGSNQTFSAGKASANIRFKLSDAFNNGVTGQVIDFKVKTPAGEISNEGLSATLATSDVNGKVMTRLEATDSQGIYTIIATLAANETVTANTTVQVTEALPNLPSLGFGAATDNDWNEVDTTAIFQGGISVNNGAFNQEVVLASGDSVLIKGVIKVDSLHVEQSADILVVVGYAPFNAAEKFFMLDSNHAVQLWDGSLANLVAFESVESLVYTKVVTIYSSKLTPVGRLRIYFGYRLDDGIIVFNASQPISVVVM
ncbi:MAG: hypothetical protein DRR08_15690 [Candidatus Parabeggiatoa sp. nov. 2]|nr:MAG: hypothetical protein DRR08_15690 [Gammaproteobacteria bacterium]